MDRLIRYLVTKFYSFGESTRYALLLGLLSIVYFILWNGFYYIHDHYHSSITWAFGTEHIHKVIEYIFCIVLAFASLSVRSVMGKRKLKGLELNTKESEELLNGFEERIDQLSQALDNRERALQASNKQRGAMLNAIPDLILQLDKTGTIRCWSGPVGDLYIAPSKMLGNNINEYMPIEIANLGMRYIDLTLKTGELQIFEYQLPIRDGLQSFEVRMAKMDSNHVMMIARNITEVRTIEALNLRQANMFRHMADNLPEMLWSKDLEDRYVFVNSVYKDKLLENPNIILEGRRVEGAIPNETTAFNIKETDVIVKRDKVSKRFLIKHVSSSGIEMWLDIYKSPWWSLNEPKRIIGTVGSARDITECMPTVSKKYLKDVTMVEASFDQCFHWSSDDPACNTCITVDGDD